MARKSSPRFTLAVFASFYSAASYLSCGPSDLDGKIRGSTYSATNTNDQPFTVTTTDSNSSTGDPQTPATDGNPNITPANSGTPATAKSTFFMGILPDYDNGSTNGIAGFVSRTKITPYASSGYVNVGPSGSFQTSTGQGYIKEAKQQGVKIISLSMSAWQSGALTSSQLASVSALITTAQTQGIELWLRYGYEMNYGGGGDQYGRINQHNNPADFKTQWAQVAQVANPYRFATPAVKMFWSPNIFSGGDLPYTSWLPKDPNTIDVIGVDWYVQQNDPMTSTSISKTLRDIYNIVQQKHWPFMLGETAVSLTGTGETEAAAKIRWLTALCDSQVRQNMPEFQGFFWFDYKKGDNFAVSQDSYSASKFTSWYHSTFITTSD